MLYLTVVYRADHLRLVMVEGAFDPAAVDIELPLSHEEALVYFVPSRLFSPWA
ncbi:hypothetical protein [Pseudomonas oryzae]|uniref:hypothetical protein n=1 Tax=Pseudomonas oryzae TaxID=1392877 RepID=UPI0012FDC569|nr:hypothetical protein [Pseudomonas oryzae]